VTYEQVYSCCDFIKYCKALEPARHDDLIQEVSLIIYSMDKSQKEDIEKQGYMLRYAQRTAFYTHVKWYRNQNKLPILFDSIDPYFAPKGTEIKVREKAMNLIKQDLKTKEYSIPAKMFIYSCEHGSIQNFSKASKIPYKTLQMIVKGYKNRIKKCVRE